MRTALLLPFFALATLGQAQVFTSDLETWIGDTVPADWFGVKTNLESDSVAQVTTNPHGGAFAVQLINRENATRRFSTQPLAVDSAQGYDITYWVRGQGEVRVSMFDGRTENSGYAPNGPYTTVSSNSWTQLTATVVCDRTNPAGEFIIYVRNTIAPGDVVVDDVNIVLGELVEPTDASIYAIQFTTDAGGASPLATQPVITGGICTAAGDPGYFLQAGTGAWSGIWVSDTVNAPAIGDSVLLTAVVNENFFNTRLFNVSAFSIASSSNTLPNVSYVNPQQANNEAFEGVLVGVINMPCVTTPNDFGEWQLLASGTATVMVDDLFYPFTPTIGASYNVTGPLNYTFGRFKLEPRFAADIELFTAIDEHLFSNATLGPNPAIDVLRINTGLPTGTLANYTLTDALGRTVRTGILNGNGTLAVDDLTNGLYHLTLRAANGVKSFAVEVR